MVMDQQRNASWRAYALFLPIRTKSSVASNNGEKIHCIFSSLFLTNHLNDVKILLGGIEWQIIKLEKLIQMK